MNEINIGSISAQTKNPQISKTNSWISTDNDTLHIFRHEYGHAIKTNGLSQEEYEKWYYMWKDKTKDYWKKTVSEYGATSPDELFAESFARYTSTAYEKGMLPAKIESILDRVLKPVK